MKSQRLVLALSLPMALFFASCDKENAAPGLTYQVATSTTATAIISGGTVNASLKWNSGYANVVEIEFEALSNNVEIEYKSEVKQKINFFAPLSTLGLIVVPAGTYDDVEFEIEVEPVGADAALSLSGSYTNNAVVTPVNFKLNAELEIESEQSRLVIADGSSLNAITTLNLSLITTGVSVSMLDNALRTNGVIEISATNNTPIYDIILRNLKACGGVEIDD